MRQEVIFIGVLVSWIGLEMVAWIVPTPFPAVRVADAPISDVEAWVGIGQLVWGLAGVGPFLLASHLALRLQTGGRGAYIGLTMAGAAASGFLQGLIIRGVLALLDVRLWIPPIE